MSTIQTTTATTLQARTEIAFKNEANELSGVIERYLRKRFENAHIDATALAIIELTEEEDLHDLANEFKVAFSLQTGRR